MTLADAIAFYEKDLKERRRGTLHPATDPYVTQAEAALRAVRGEMERVKRLLQYLRRGGAWCRCSGFALEEYDAPPVEEKPTMDGVWRCQDCGEMVDQVSPKWRWAGDRWQHHHDYPIGHVDATYFGAPVESEG